MLEKDRRTEARLAHPIYGEAVRQSMPREVAGLAAAGVSSREELARILRS